jgi:energy-coupling factor transporter ATP-binding protein EcfA2
VVARHVLSELGALAIAGLLGALIALVLRRHSTLSIRNLYAPAILGLAATLAALAAGEVLLAAALAPIATLAVAASLVGRPCRLHDLGAGEELRQHELARRWIWQPAPTRQPGERVYIASQGELVHRRPWTRTVPRIAMGERDDERFSLPLGEGQHVFLAGATGSGKTTTARRLLAARTLGEQAALLVLDQKGDQHDVEQLQRLAAAAGVAFVLIDPLDLGSDRYQPLWGAPAQVAARAVEPIKVSEPYYYDMLRLHLDLVCRLLHAGDLWPPSVPLLVDAAHPAQYPALLRIAEHLGSRHATLKRRARQHAAWVSSPKGREALDGGAGRLEVALALATREIVTPRITDEGEAVAVGLLEALSQRAVVMWRLHADVMPDEAAAMTVLVLADLHDAAARAGVPWTLLLDEFGAVIQIAATRATAILQRGRTHGGQVVVATQSVIDAEALTQQSGLLASLTDNFSGVVATPPDRARITRLAGEADGNPRALAIHQPNQRPWRPALRARIKPPRTRVPDRLRRVRRARARRSRDLHHPRPGPETRSDRHLRTPTQPTATNRFDAPPVRVARAPNRHARGSSRRHRAANHRTDRPR